MDCFGDHALVCRQGNDKIKRHDDLIRVLCDAAKRAGLCPVREQLHLLPDNNRRPGDITFSSGDESDNPHTIAYDVTISDTLQQSSLSNAAAESGHVLSRAIQGKLSKHRESCEAAGIKFIPLAWESMGGSSPSVHEVVDEWTAAAANRRGVSSEDGLAIERFGLFCRLSVALQRFQAGMILRRISLPSLLPSPPPSSPSHSSPPPSPQLDPRTTLAPAIPPDYLYVPFDESRAVRV